MLRVDRTLTGEQLKRDLGGDTLLLLGLKPDEQELFEEIKQKGFKYTISLPLFRMSLYRKITGMLGQGESISGGLAGEELMYQLTIVGCVLGAFAGGLLAVRRCGSRALIVGLTTGGVLFLLLLTIGALCFETVSLEAGGIGLLCGSLCGGAAAGILGGGGKKKPARKKRRK